MHLLLDYLPHLLAMALLIGASAFFSCSEAALFYLRRDQREVMAGGSRSERAAIRLLHKPERVLTAILFWNLLVNMAYFALASIVALGIGRQGATTEASLFSAGALLSVIIFCEMLPKNLGVVWPVQLASLVSMPLGIAARVLDPVAPFFRSVNRGAGRVLFPQFKSEPYLELTDLERAISISGGDKQLIEQERNVLSRIVALADIRVEEIMRPRLLYEALPPPVKRSDLTPEITVGGYVLVTESDSEEIDAVIDAQRAALSAQDNLAMLTSPTLPAPWCATAADTLNRLDAAGLEVAVVVNELGETIGVVTRGDLLATILQSEAARDATSPRVERIKPIADGQWEVSGMTTLRRFAKHVGCLLPATKGITITGMLQAQLHALPQEDDQADWGGFRWRVLRADHVSLVKVLVTRLVEETDSSTN